MSLHSVGEDDPCPGHYSIGGMMIPCSLPFGHRGVSQEPYDWRNEGAFDPEPDQNEPSLTEEGSY